MLNNKDIHLRDTFIMVYNGKYYMYGTRADNCFTSPMDGFDCYVGTDLENWEGPFEIYHNDGTNKAEWAYYAPECYNINGKFYLLCSWKEKNSCEYENILVSDSPVGPFTIYSENLLEGIDATLFNEDGKYYLINSHNMTNEHRGIYATQLSDDFTSTAGDSFMLFSTENCPWISETSFNGQPNRLTDGPCPYVLPSGKLIILWSSRDKSGQYNIGICASDNGRLNGQWIHEKEPFFDGNKGHCMLFRDLKGQLTAAMHAPNVPGSERPYFLAINENDSSLSPKPQA